MFPPPHKKAGSPVPQAPAAIQTVKHKHFANTVTLRIDGGYRRGVGWREALGRCWWYLIIDGTQRDLNDLVFGK